MDNLQEHISKRIEERGYCTIFENDLLHSFAIDLKGRKKLAEFIRAFAEERGWSVEIKDPGIRATFRKLKSG
jgi:hypothetical protein